MRSNVTGSARKQLLYQAEGKEKEGKGSGETGGADGTVATAVLKKKRGRTRKTVHLVNDGNKKNVDPSTGTLAGKKRAKYCADTG